MHFNDNKYRFQSRRNKHQYDKGDVLTPSVLVNLFDEYQEHSFVNPLPPALAENPTQQTNTNNNNNNNQNHQQNHHAHHGHGKARKEHRSS
jgi:hypothetical protein